MITAAEFYKWAKIFKLTGNTPTPPDDNIITPGPSISPTINGSFTIPSPIPVYIAVTATNNGDKLVLPVLNSETPPLSVGQKFVIFSQNKSIDVVYDNNALLKTIPAGFAFEFIINSNSTANTGVFVKNIVNTIISAMRGQLTGDIALITDDITEGATNKFYTDARAKNAVNYGAVDVILDLALWNQETGKIFTAVYNNGVNNDGVGASLVGGSNFSLNGIDGVNVSAGYTIFVHNSQKAPIKIDGGSAIYSAAFNGPYVAERVGSSTETFKLVRPTNFDTVNNMTSYLPLWVVTGGARYAQSLIKFIRLSPQTVGTGGVYYSIIPPFPVNTSDSSLRPIVDPKFTKGNNFLNITTQASTPVLKIDHNGLIFEKRGTDNINFILPNQTTNSTLFDGFETGFYIAESGTVTLVAESNVTIYGDTVLQSGDKVNIVLHKIGSVNYYYINIFTPANFITNNRINAEFIARPNQAVTGVPGGSIFTLDAQNYQLLNSNTSNGTVTWLINTAIIGQQYEAVKKTSPNNSMTLDAGSGNTIWYNGVTSQTFTIAAGIQGSIIFKRDTTNSFEILSNTVITIPQNLSVNTLTTTSGVSVGSDLSVANKITTQAILETSFVETPYAPSVLILPLVKYARCDNRTSEKTLLLPSPESNQTKEMIINVLSDDYAVTLNTAAADVYIDKNDGSPLSNSEILRIAGEYKIRYFMFDGVKKWFVEFPLFDRDDPQNIFSSTYTLKMRNKFLNIFTGSGDCTITLPNISKFKKGVEYTFIKPIGANNVHFSAYTDGGAVTNYIQNFLTSTRTATMSNAGAITLVSMSDSLTWQMINLQSATFIGN